MTIEKMKMQMTEKITQKVSSNGRIVIPKEWRDKLAIEDKNEVEMDINYLSILSINYCSSG